jgi:hypothetical protein
MVLTFLALCELALASLLDNWLNKYLIPIHQEQGKR